MPADILSEAAKAVGAEDGKEKGGIVNGLGLDAHDAKKIIEGYESGDEGVLDLCPKPLAGEWADDPIPFNILDKIANKADPGDSLMGADLEEDTEDLMDIYEQAFAEAFWEETIKYCKEIVA